MVSLITVAAVKKRMAMPDIPASDPIIQTAIDASHLRMEAELDTKFDLNTNTDVFLLDKSKCGHVIPDGVFRLRLKRSFVRASPAMVILSSGSLDFTGAEVVVAAGVNTEKGFLFIDKAYEGSYIQVAYSSGFVADSEAPAWLKEAIISYVPVAFNMGQVTKKKDQNLPAIKASADHALQIAAIGTRVMGFAISPVLL